MRIWQLGGEKQTELGIVRDYIVANLHAQLPSASEEVPVQNCVQRSVQFRANVLNETRTTESHATLHHPKNVLVVHLCNCYTV